jgi:hypothetical protein
MTAEQAANLLNTQLRGTGGRWLTAVGVGEIDDAPAIYVYVQSAPRSPELAGLASGWMGWPVVVQRMGAPRPIKVFTPPPRRRAVRFGGL